MAAVRVLGYTYIFSTRGIHMKRFLAGVLVGVMMAATSAVAYEVVFPNRLKPKAQAIVDEIGAIVFGTVPGRVEISNWPAPVACDEGDGGQAWRWFGALEQSQSADALTVPAGTEIHLTDVLMSVQNSSGGGFVEVQVDGVTILELGTRLASGQPGHPSPSFSPTTPIVIVEGAVVSVVAGNYSATHGTTLLGRLVPTS
jgi:hypothetical protein